MQGKEVRGGWGRVFYELGRHVPFTAFGAFTGIVIMATMIFGDIPRETSYTIFYILHPAHVLLSALVTTGIYARYGGKIWVALLIGYTGSVGIATVSDSLIPYGGEQLLRLPNPGIHLGLIEKWWLVNPLAFAGIALGYWKRVTRFPHYGHVLLSTWASLFHMTMALGLTIGPEIIFGVFVFLFLAVWIPCCLSDIVYPLLFVKKSSTS